MPHKAFDDSHGLGKGNMRRRYDRFGGHAKLFRPIAQRQGWKDVASRVGFSLWGPCPNRLWGGPGALRLGSEEGFRHAWGASEEGSRDACGGSEEGSADGLCE